MIEWMQAAIAQAEQAREIDEVPVGAVIVYDGKIIASGYNTRENTQNPLMHAEIAAIGEASKVIGSWRLYDCDLYVTLEPCPMCAGAIVQARMRHVYFGAYDPKAGCAGTVYNLLQEPCFNHQTEVTGGVLEPECRQLLQNYFAEKRK